MNVGLAVGLTLGLCFGLCFLALRICILVVVHCNFKRRKRNSGTGVVTTTPTSGPHVVAPAQETSFTTTPTAYPTQPHPTQPHPTPPYPTQPTPAPHLTQPQPVYKDAQLSSGEAPPSYDAAIAYPPYIVSVSDFNKTVIIHLLEH